jgi:hypothetical protein
MTAAMVASSAVCTVEEHQQGAGDVAATHSVNDYCHCCLCCSYLQFEETDKELTMMVKPRFVPPGFPRYQEYYDKTQQEEKTWALRRDLKTGRSYGRIFFAADGTIIFRWARCYPCSA